MNESEATQISNYVAGIAGHLEFRRNAFISIPLRTKGTELPEYGQISLPVLKMFGNLFMNRQNSGLKMVSPEKLILFSAFAVFLAFRII